MGEFGIHWFPGHMAKTRRMIEENLRLVDVVAELTDARIPESGRNPLLNEIIGNKPRVLLLNKRDYADEAATRQWLGYYKSRGIIAAACDCRSGAGLKNIASALNKVVGERKYAGAVRVMVVGIPNVGKSSFINRMAGGKKTAVGDRPGVTRGKQWVKISGETELLDMPGILPPRLYDRRAALNLAYVGAVKDEVMDVTALAESLAEYLSLTCPERIAARYKLSSPGNVVEKIAESRGMLTSGGLPDIERAALTLLDEFRGAKIGRITLEHPVHGV